MTKKYLFGFLNHNVYLSQAPGSKNATLQIMENSVVKHQVRFEADSKNGFTRATESARKWIERKEGGEYE